MNCGHCKVADLHIGDVIEIAWGTQFEKWGRIVGIEPISQSTCALSWIEIKTPDDTIGVVRCSNVRLDRKVWVVAMTMPNDDDTDKARRALESIQ